MITSFKNLVMCMPKFFHMGMTTLKLYSNDYNNTIENCIHIFMLIHFDTDDILSIIYLSLLKHW